MITNTSSFKFSVVDCIYKLNTVSNCTGGQNGVLDDYTGTGDIESVTTVDGKIVAKGSTTLNSATYELEANFDFTNDRLQWIYSGSCQTFGYCNLQ